VDEGATGWWPAPGKLNLMLRVVGRRPDGYHLLQTLFQFIDHGDRLRFRVTGDGAIRRAGGVAGLAEEQDLTVRAARRLQAGAGSGLGVWIDLDKRLPPGGGLGGGSSDAATTLVALNRLWGLGLSPERLAGIGLELGADVPVFVLGRAAWAEGVGERLTPVELPEPWYLVVAPPCSVSTAEVFSDPELTRNSPPVTISDFLRGARGNDCLAVARRRYPAVAEALDWLGEYAESRLTGTGACVFAAFDSRMEARAVLDRLPPAWQGFVARGLNRSPLLDRIEDLDGPGG
jgi:4-diphosphocytidyl-2-C-methyl-D-erythritol kinase